MQELQYCLFKLSNKMSPLASEVHKTFLSVIKNCCKCTAQTILQFSTRAINICISAILQYKIEFKICEYSRISLLYIWLIKYIKQGYLSTFLGTNLTGTSLEIFRKFFKYYNNQNLLNKHFPSPLKQYLST